MRSSQYHRAIDEAYSQLSSPDLNRPQAQSFLEACRRYAIAMANAARLTEEAEDAAQDTLLRIFKHIHSYKPTAPISSWVSKICANVITSRKSRPLHLQLLDGYEAPEAAEPSIQLPHLSEREREMLRLHFVEGLTYKEIGAKMGYSHKTVNEYTNRAIRRCKSMGRDTVPLSYTGKTP